MKLLNPTLTSTLLLSMLLTACASSGRTPSQMASNIINRQSITPTTSETYPPKNPQTVAVFNTKKAPPAAYRVIGVAHVSKYTFLGAKREEATVHKMMKNLAASIGGDALVDVNNNESAIEAKVIAFQKIML